MQIKPLGDRILVKQLPSEEVTASGIVLPDSAEKEKPNQGIIVALGNGEAIRKLDLKVGDKVVYTGYSLPEVEAEIDGKKEICKVVFVADDDDSQVVAVIE